MKYLYFRVYCAPLISEKNQFHFDNFFVLRYENWSNFEARHHIFVSGNRQNRLSFDFLSLRSLNVVLTLSIQKLWSSQKLISEIYDTTVKMVGKTDVLLFPCILRTPQFCYNFYEKKCAIYTENYGSSPLNPADIRYFMTKWNEDFWLVESCTAFRDFHQWVPPVEMFHKMSPKKKIIIKWILNNCKS